MTKQTEQVIKLIAKFTDTKITIETAAVLQKEVTNHFQRVENSREADGLAIDDAIILFGIISESLEARVTKEYVLTSITTIAKNIILCRHQ